MWCRSGLTGSGQIQKSGAASFVCVLASERAAYFLLILSLAEHQQAPARITTPER